MKRALTVLGTGAQVLVQDLGRPGYAHLGVPPSGALDPPALRLANRLVGNHEPAAGLEVLLGGLRLRAECSCTVAVTGPGVPVSVDDRAVGSHAPVHLKEGQTLALGAPERGLRNYVAVSGGVDVDVQLGSRSSDLLSGLGPEQVRAGDVLPLGVPAGLPIGVDTLPPERAPEALWVEVLLGPREDWFDDPAGQLTARTWTVTSDSNRVGLRLTGTALEVLAEYRGKQLPSEPVITGAVQVPSSGQPVIFLADHPTTGGYPVIGVVHADELPALAQARPGTTIQFRVVHP
ncbi:MAG: 5-oxoprolinase/urea amidolyase family protein [Pseudonocardiaceae bacterium]|nr:5-oxoprolinase/urea amidolyase family protein [Pseudonocardiaceae bacterium]